LASVTFLFENLAEFKADLLRLPIELRAEAGAIVLAQARLAAAAIRGKYPRGKTGNLQNGVRVSKEAADQFSAMAHVVSAAPHVLIYERGTRTRLVKKDRRRKLVVRFPDGSYRTMKRNRGAMRPRPVFVPTIVPFRHGMEQRLAELMRRAGLEVQMSA